MYCTSYDIWHQVLEFLLSGSMRCHCCVWMVHTVLCGSGLGQFCGQSGMSSGQQSKARSHDIIFSAQQKQCALLLHWQYQFGQPRPQATPRFYFAAVERNYWTNRTIGCEHVKLHSRQNYNLYTRGTEVDAQGLQCQALGIDFYIFYLSISVMTPVPTVLLPSLRVNLWFTSRGMSFLRVSVRGVSSPGITISLSVTQEKGGKGSIMSDMLLAMKD